MGFVDLKNVCKRYKVGEITISAADKIEFSIDRGELAIVLGPSGSGKTTVLNLLGGMDTADEGSILVDGNDIAKYSRKQLIGYRRNEIGFVFQFYNLIPNLTAKENVELAAQTCTDFIPALDILEQVGLKDRPDNFPSQLSGGEQQRVCIARALAKNPQILFLDEPTGALDEKTGRSVLDYIAELHAERKFTMIMVTHNAN
ncbi:MAG: ABC transporter ATP-binding protein, partial [Ruminiclostridium sp.]|nr:ABC transporter ATP-binding protein [Ruminiclostridium sp.]